MPPECKASSRANSPEAFEAGYNWQPSNFLFGLEGDIKSFHLHGSANFGPVVYHGGAGTFTLISNASTDWLATARGRLGYAAGTWLFYATGGFAFTDLHGNFSFAETAFGGSEAASLSSSKTGYTVGGGVEASLSRQWSVKAEYLFVDFGKVSAFGIAAGGVLIPRLPVQPHHGPAGQYRAGRRQLSLLSIATGIHSDAVIPTDAAVHGCAIWIRVL